MKEIIEDGKQLLLIQPILMKLQPRPLRGRPFMPSKGQPEPSIRNSIRTFYRRLQDG